MPIGRIFFMTARYSMADINNKVIPEDNSFSVIQLGYGNMSNDFIPGIIPYSVIVKMAVMAATVEITSKGFQAFCR